MLFVEIGRPIRVGKQDVASSDVLLRPWKPLLRNGGMIFQSVGSADPVNYPGRASRSARLSCPRFAPK
ncbi:hypothetical protein ACVMFA_009678 [Bradyrhizobium liaoningense]